MSATGWMSAEMVEALAQVIVLTALSTSVQTGSIEAAPQREPIQQSVELQIPVPPTPIRIGGEIHLVYELHITNLQPDNAILKSVAVTDDTGRLLAQAEGDGLARIVRRPGLRVDRDTKLVIAPGSRAVLNFWITLGDAATVPAGLRHGLALDIMRASEVEARGIDGFEVAVRPDVVPTLDPPLRGGPWVAAYDPHLEQGHRMVHYTVHGHTRIPGRYAIDWFRIGDDGLLAEGDPARYPNWHGYGADVFAVADGVVVEAFDDLPEDLDASRRRRPLPLEEHSGNYVILNIGGGNYAVYEHLKPGSVRVRNGDRVRRGEPIGEVGNSGSTFGPHLHFHLAGTAAVLAAEGVPYAFTEYRVVGAFDSIREFMNGGEWKSTGAPEQRQDDLPAANEVVEFKALR